MLVSWVFLINSSVRWTKVTLALRLIDWVPYTRTLCRALAKNVAVGCLSDKDGFASCYLALCPTKTSPETSSVFDTSFSASVFASSQPLSLAHTCKASSSASANASTSNWFTRWSLRCKRKTMGTFPFHSMRLLYACEPGFSKNPAFCHVLGTIKQSQICFLDSFPFSFNCWAWTFPITLAESFWSAIVID